MGLVPDPAIGQSILTPRGYTSIPGVDEETRPINPAPPSETDSHVFDPAPSFLDNILAPDPLLAGIVAAGRLSETPVVQAAFRSSNTVGSAIARVVDTYGVSNELVDPNYSPWKDVVGTPYEDYWKSTFVHSNNAQYTAALKHSIDRQIQDERTVAAGGWGGTIAGIVAGTVDPTLLLPVGGEVSLAGKGVWTLARGAAAGARAGALGSTAYELALHASQDIRTPEQSALTIATGTILGATIGGAAAAALSRTQRVASEAGIEALAGKAGFVPGSSAGAAQVHPLTLDDLTIEGTLARNSAAALAFSPNLRGNFREAPLARQTYQEIGTNVFRQQMHDEGLTVGPSIGTNINTSLGETLDQAVPKHAEIYSAGRKADMGMSLYDFNQAVGQAMRREDVGANDFVSQSAQMWRNTVIQPLADQAIKLGLLPEDVSVTDAPSYFMRLYNVDKLVAQKPDFMNITTEHFNTVLQQQFLKSADTLRARHQSLDEEVSNLRLGPEDRVKKLADIEGQRQSLEQQFGPAADIADKVRSARAEARAAKEAGNTEAEAAANAKVESLKQAGGADFQTFKSQEAKLKKSARQVNLGYGGMQSKADAISQQLTDLTHSNFRSLQRLVARGQKLSTELRKLDPQKVVQTVSDLRSDFYGLVQRSGQKQDTLAKQVEALRTDEDKKVQSALAEAGLNKEKLNKKEQAKAAKIEKEVRANNTAVADRLSKGLDEERARNARLQKISDRLQAAEAIDRTGDINDVKTSIDELVQELSNRSLGRGERASELLDRLSRVDPSKVDARIAEIEQFKKDMTRKFLDRWEIKRMGEGVDLTKPENTPDFMNHAKDMAQDVYDRITGNDFGSASVDPSFNLAARSGPLKDRTFHIPDQKIEQFLEDDVNKVMPRFAQQMSAQIEVARKFPGDPTLTQRFKAIKDQYDTLINHAATEPERRALQKDMDGAFRDLRAMLEMHRGSYMAKENASSFGRLTRALLNFNIIRSMGGPVIRHLSNIYNPAIFHGIGPAMEVGVPALIHSLDALGPMQKEAQFAGIFDRAAHHNLITLAEVGDPYAKGTAIERLLDKGTQVATKWNGLSFFINTEKNVASIVVQHRLNQALLADKDVPFLAYSGMDAAMRAKVADQLRQHSSEIDGITVANTDQWDNWDAIRAYRNAINFNVNADIVTRGVGDVPLFAHTPLGRMLFQFRTFNLAAHQRTMLRAMQMGPAQFASSLIGLTTVGMAAATLRAWRNGQKSWDDFKSSARNPGYMVGEGLDSSGLFTVPLELADIAEKTTAPTGYAVNPIKTPLMLAGRLFVPDASIQGNTQRFMGGGAIDALGGPTAGLIADVPQAASIPVDKITGKPVSVKKTHAAERIVPYSSFLGMRELLQMLEGNSPYNHQ